MNPPQACMTTHACRLILTAAEDGDVRAWDGRSGSPLASVRAHQGRGAWCMSPLSPTTIATGGGDCALKLWHLPTCLPPPAAAMLLQPVDPDTITPPPPPAPAAAAEAAVAAAADAPPPQVASGTLQCTTRMPDALTAHAGSSECICALALASATRLYVATSLGRVMRVDVSLSQASCRADWGGVCDVSAGGMHLSCCAARPLHACMPCMHSPGDDGAAGREPSQTEACRDSCTSAADVAVVGSRQGSVTIVRVPAANPAGADVIARWAAPAGGVTSVYLLDALPPGHVLCASAGGRLWWLFVPALTPAGHTAHSTPSTAAPEAEARRGGDAAPAGEVVVAGWCVINQKQRIAAAGVVPAAGLVVVGDSVGGLTGFAVPGALMRARSTADVDAALQDAAASAGDQQAASDSGAEGARVGREFAAVGREFAAVCRFARSHGTHPVTMVAAVEGCVYTGGRNGAAPPA